MNAHARAALTLVRDEARLHWHDAAVWNMRTKRDRAAAAVPDWEALRDAASRIKLHTLSRLAEYLEQFERKALALGAQVHWARDAAEHNEIVLGLLRDRGVTRLVKSKSMLTEECHLNPFLEAARHRGRRHRPRRADRAARRRAAEPHRACRRSTSRRRRSASCSTRTLGTAGRRHRSEVADRGRPPAPAREVPRRPGRAHRRELRHRRDRRLRRLHQRRQRRPRGGAAAAPHRLMGIEKLIPRRGGPARVPAAARPHRPPASRSPRTPRTSTGRGPAASCTSCWWTTAAATCWRATTFRRSLNCIRCGACMNTCPVYRRSGGHSYGTTVPGPDRLDPRARARRRAERRAAVRLQPVRLVHATSAR